jgi:hypothetical protein
MKDLIEGTINGTSFNKLLPPEFVQKHEKVTGIIKTGVISDEQCNLLKTILGDETDKVIKFFFSKEEKVEEKIDESQPTILLSSFEGCKGLSAGHVFIVGLNQGVVPKTTVPEETDDFEYSKFIVALTRTRKQCHLLSNEWDFFPTKVRHRPSFFLDFIPAQYLENKGYLKIRDIK